jgi:hypothetical protein
MVVPFYRMVISTATVDLLTNVMLYWVTGSIGSSTRLCTRRTPRACPERFVAEIREAFRPYCMMST